LATALIPYVSGPNLGGYWNTIPLLAAANAGQHVTFAHAGGTIGVFLADYNAFGDNVPGSPNPSYSLSLESSPGALIDTVTPSIFTATPTLFGGGVSYAAAVYRATYLNGGMELQPPQTGITGWTAALYTVAFTQSPLTATLTAAPSALSLCAPGPSLLSWTTTGAASVSIDNGIGVVALSGSLSVNPLVTTTYTLTATGPGGAVTSTATITVTPYIIDQQLPSVTTGAAAWFGGKRVLAAGAYRIRYLGGAYQFDKNKGFAIAGGGSIPNMGGAFSGFHLTDGVTDAPFAPGGSGLYAVPGDAFAASAGAKVVYPHAGGPLGVYLSQQALGYANAAILGTTPVFEIFGPVPTAALSASTNVIRAGQQVTLSWTTVVGAATLDNGIGAVAASGTQSVSPAVTTLYTLSCADPCNTATSSTLVTVLPPGTPPALMTTLSPGTITLTASPPPLSQGLTTIDGYQFLRSATSGSGYAPLGTSLTPTFTDTTASLGVPYFYVCRGYSGSQYSGYSPEAPAFLPLAPPAPAGLALRPGSGQVLLAWNAPAAIYGSFGGTSQIAGSPALTASVFRSLAPGGEGATPVKTGISSPFWLDLGLTNGLTYYYTVVFVNVSGSGAASAEVSGVPQSGLGWG